jgi:hypothetical protein
MATALDGRQRVWLGQTLKEDHGAAWADLARLFMIAGQPVRADAALDLPKAKIVHLPRDAMDAFSPASSSYSRTHIRTRMIRKRPGYRHGFIRNGV